MNKRNLFVLVCATLATFASVSVFAGPPKTLYCNQTVSFNGLGDCGGTANLACGPGGVLLYYNNMTSCRYYTYVNNPYVVTPIGQVVTLEPNQRYQAKLTTLPDFNGPGTLLTIDTTYNQPAPQPQPLPPQDNHQMRSPYNYSSAQDVYMNNVEAPLRSCGANGGVKVIRGSAGSAIAIIRGSTECSRVDVFNQFEQYTGQSADLKYNAGTVVLDGVQGNTVILKLHSVSGEHGEYFYVHVN